MTNKTLLILVACLMTALSSSAKSFRLAPGEPLRSSAAYHEVKGRQGILIRQRLSFGPYATTRILRSAIRSWTGTNGVPGILAAEHMQGRQSIRFSLSNGFDTAHTVAVTRVSSADLIIGNRRNSLPNILLDIMATGSARQQNNFSASIITQGGETWELFLDNTAAQLRRNEAAGFFRSSDTYYVIVPVWEITRKGRTSALPFGAAGLEFRDEQGRTCAAVSLIDDGEVILPHSDNPENLLLAAACSALLLQSNIDQERHQFINK